MARRSEERFLGNDSGPATIGRRMHVALRTSRVQDFSEVWERAAGKLERSLVVFLEKSARILGESYTAFVARRFGEVVLSSAERFRDAARSSFCVLSVRRARRYGMGLALLVGVLTNAMLFVMVGEPLSFFGWVIRGVLALLGIALLGGVLTLPMVREGYVSRWLCPP